MTKSKKILLAIIATILLSVGIFYYGGHFNCVEIRVLAFNDFHGAIEEIEGIGASKFVNEIKKETTETTLVISAGDNYNGQAISNLLYGKPVSEIFKEINVVASAIGNHEFDWGTDKISVWEEDMNAPFVSANIVKNGDYIVKPYIIKEVKGIKVAFIGLTTLEASYKSNRNFIKYFEFLDPVETAKKMVKEVKSKGADIVILLTHIGTFTDKDTGVIKFENKKLEELTRIDGVNAIITAHYHKEVSGFINDVPVVQSLPKGQSFSIIEFDINKKSKKIYFTEIFTENLVEKKDELEDDQKTLEIIEKYNNQLSGILEENIGMVKEKISYDKYKKSPLGDLITSILKDSVNADISMLNGGSITGEILPGVLKIKDVYSILPFDNLFVVANIQGKDIKTIMDHGMSGAEIGRIQYSGIKKINDTYILDNGEPLEDEKYYKVATNDFMTSGGDLYNFDNAKDIEEIGYIRNAVIEGLRKKYN